MTRKLQSTHSLESSVASNAGFIHAAHDDTADSHQVQSKEGHGLVKVSLLYLLLAVLWTLQTAMILTFISVQYYRNVHIPRYFGGWWSLCLDDPSCTSGRISDAVYVTPLTPLTPMNLSICERF